MRTTVGQLLINDALPEELRDYDRVIDKKSLRNILHELYVIDPSRYRDTAKALSDIGRIAAYRQGASISLDAMKPVAERDAVISGLQAKLLDVVSDPTLDDDERNRMASDIISGFGDISGLIHDSLKKTDNPFALQVSSGARGNPSQLAALVGASVSALDSYGRVLPIPITHSISEGLDPAEFWALTYSARKGLIDTKFETGEAGYIGKQLSQSAHRLVVTEEDCGTPGGLMVDASDSDSLGAVLAKTSGSHDAGTVLTPQKLKSLAKAEKKITIRSPITCQAEQGVCQMCAGIRERGTFPPIGDIVGISAASALAEKLSQGMLHSKHRTSGEKGAIGGLEYIEQLISVPQHYKGGAAHATVDGRITEVEEAPQGGTYIYIGKERHYAPPGLTPTVKRGDEVEAGDILSDGIPNPAKMTRYKGIGEGRRYFADLLRKAFDETGQYANRRNTELVARALINHVRVTDTDAGSGTFPDDVVEYDALQRTYEPRYGSINLKPDMAVGKYLERPALHYSIGTRITGRVAGDLRSGGVGSVLVHMEPPSFIPEMHRALDSLGLSPDWLVQQGGFYIKRRLLDSVHRGAKSDIKGISYIPRIVTGGAP